MKSFTHRIVVLSIVMEFCWSGAPCSARRAEQMQELYKKIGEELIAIRKQFTEAQPKIYLVLDQLDKMYGIAKSGLQRKKEIKKNLKEKEREVVALKKELEKTKSELVLAQQTSAASQQALSEVSQKFDVERQQSLLLANEKDKLVEKIKTIAESSRQVAEEKRILAQAKTSDVDEELQNLTRNSTSEPSSSR